MSRIIRACADDIGITLTRLRHLKLVCPIYAQCMHLAGLALKPIKCVLVPLCRFTPEIQQSISRWISSNIYIHTHTHTHHIEGAFQIEPLAKLSGFYIGPQAGAKMWKAQLANTMIGS